MKYLEMFLLFCMAALIGYTLCAWSPEPHLVQVMDQGKPGKEELLPQGLQQFPVVRVPFSTTPTFSVESPATFVPAEMTGDVKSVTFSNLTVGSQFSIAWTQDHVGHRKVNYSGSAYSVCDLSPLPNTTTLQYFVVVSKSQIYGTECVTRDATAGTKILRLNDPTAEFQIIDARDPLIVALGKAIAREEGFGKPGTLATVNHNPGNLIYAHQQGAGIAIMLGASEGYATFLTDDVGWAALYADLRAKWKMVCGLANLQACCPGGSHPMGDAECKVYAISYSWSQGDREKYARDIVADLKARGLLK